MMKNLPSQEAPASPSKEHPYADILTLPRPVSSRHKPMPIAERAAQFAPFAALTGYADVIREASRLTEHRIELGEDAKEELNRMLQLLAAKVRSYGRSEAVRLTYFCPDARKDGGSYRTCTGCVVKFPSDRQVLVLESEDPSAPPECIPLQDIVSLSFQKDYDSL